MKLRSKIAGFLSNKLGTETVLDITSKLILEHSDIKIALDIGSGESSHLSNFRPQIKTIGLDAHTIDVAKENKQHDFYIKADILKMSVEQIQHEIYKVAGVNKVDLITMYSVIEHFKKHDGWKLLEKLEVLSKRFILIETPNGFVPQGPEYGNPYQRHLSGWFPHDLRGLGYSVYGSYGTKYMRGYMGEPRIKFPGAQLLDDIVLTRILYCKKFPQHSFNMTAIKDLEGEEARYQSYDDPSRI
jgi:hypothetical protein